MSTAITICGNNNSIIDNIFNQVLSICNNTKVHRNTFGPIKQTYTSTQSIENLEFIKNTYTRGVTYFGYQVRSPDMCTIYNVSIDGDISYTTGSLITFYKLSIDLQNLKIQNLRVGNGNSFTIFVSAGTTLLT